MAFLLSLKCELIGAVAQRVTTPFSTDLPSVPPPPVPAGSWGQPPAIAPQPAPGSGIAGAPPPPGPWNAGPPAAPKKKGRKVLIVVAIILFLIVAAIGLLAIGIWYNTSLANQTAANVPANAPVGTCYDSNGSKQAVSCDGPHVFEVYSESYYFDEVEYPSGLTRSLGNQICEEDLGFLTGENYFLGDWDYAEVFPTKAAWLAGERRVPCVSFLGDGYQVNRPMGG